ncbi:Reverse transcriptase domain-containing protein, partial [Aphis craccivora]
MFVDELHGFRCNMSTISNLLVFRHFISDVFFDWIQINRCMRIFLNWLIFLFKTFFNLLLIKIIHPSQFVLFLEFRKDILFSTNNCVSKLMFADDVKMYRRVSNNDLLRARSTSNLNYYINGEMLFCSTSTGPIKDIGVLFDPKLNFDCHIV